MRDKIVTWFNQVREKWNALEKNTKIKIVAVALAVLFALAVAVYMTMKPEKVLLFSKPLEVNEIAQVQQYLDDQGIKNDVVNGETNILVNKRDLSKAKIAISQTDILGSDFTYGDALSYSGMTTTNEVIKENLKKAKETELQDALKLMPHVNSASVHLNIPDDSNFYYRSQRTATASVELNLKETITEQQAATIAQFVANSVENLDKENVLIMDTNATPLYNGESTAMTSIFSQYDLERQITQEIEDAVRAQLGPLFSDVRITSHLKFDWDTYQETQSLLAPPVEDSTSGVLTEETLDTSSVENSPNAQEPGVGANDGTVNQYETGGNSAYNAQRDASHRLYAYNQTESVTEKATGSLLPEQSSLSLIVYDERVYDQSALEAQGELDNISWQDFKTQTRSQLVPLEIPENLIASIETGTQIADITLIGYEIPVFIDAEVVDRPITQYLAIAVLGVLIALLAIGLIRNTQPEEVTEVEPELSVEELLVTSQEQAGEEQEDIRGIEIADSEIKRQLEKFIDEKPEAVASLLRNWLNEDWE